ncbi:zinc metalloprotease HtpX [Rickettsiales bacterium LUAb2]
MQKTIFLLAILTALFISIGYLIGGITGSIMALVFTGVMNVSAYWYSDKMVLSMAGAKIADKLEYKYYYDIVETLTKKANLPMPKLYVIDSNIPNAFATGRNHENASIAVHTSLLNILNQQELSGVLAHEIAHIKHRDILISTITAVFAGAISFIANMLMFRALFGGFHNNNNNNQSSGILAIALMIIAPLFAGIIQMAISRDREYKADNFGGKLCGNPLWLAKALLKLEASSKNIKHEKANALAHLYIINPFTKQGDNLFSTHPATNNRINALQTLAKKMNVSDNLELDITKNSNIIDTNLTTKVKAIDADVPNNPWI